MDEQETITGIIREIRAEANAIEESARVSLKTGESWLGRPYTESDFESALDLAETKRKEADQLEAALRRELSKICPKSGGDFGQFGDAAKLREALKHIKDRLPHMLQYMRVHWEDASAGGYFDELMLVINAALAAPPRNCDKYATADEALKAQEQMFNDSNFANGECKLGCPECDNPRVGCKIAWLFAPATEKEEETMDNKRVFYGALSSLPMSNTSTFSGIPCELMRPDTSRKRKERRARARELTRLRQVELARKEGGAK